MGAAGEGGRAGSGERHMQFIVTYGLDSSMRTERAAPGWERSGLRRWQACDQEGWSVPLTDLGAGCLAHSRSHSPIRPWQSGWLIPALMKSMPPMGAQPQGSELRLSPATS